MKLPLTVTGDGPRTLALVHGLGASAALWGPFLDIAVATGRYTVLTVDLRGHGEAPRADSYLLRDFAADLVETLPPTVHTVVGHSLGGAVVRQAIGRQDGPRLAAERAVYLDPGFDLGLPDGGLGGRLFWLVPPLGLLGKVALGRLSGQRTAKPVLDERTRALVAEAERKADRSMAIGVFRDVARHTMAAAEDPVVPSAVLLSDEGAAVLPDRLAEDLVTRGWQVRRISGVGHSLWLEDPQRVFDAVEDVL